MNENIEKVLAILDYFRMCDEMTYSAYCDLHDEISRLDDLLKEQEPSAPKYDVGYRDWRCPGCGGYLMLHQKYCDKCGKAVKWEEREGVQ